MNQIKRAWVWLMYRLILAAIVAAFIGLIALLYWLDHLRFTL